MRQDTALFQRDRSKPLLYVTAFQSNIVSLVISIIWKGLAGLQLLIILRQSWGWVIAPGIELRALRSMLEWTKSATETTFLVRKVYG